MRMRMIDHSQEKGADRPKHTGVDRIETLELCVGTFSKRNEGGAIHKPTHASSHSCIVLVPRVPCQISYPNQGMWGREDEAVLIGHVVMTESLDTRMM